MLNLLKALRQDEHGVILSAEIVIVGTVLVIGVMTGMVCLQKSVNGELGDLAKAIDSIDQSYSFSGHRKARGFNGHGDCCAFTAGSAFANNECNTNPCNTDLIGCESHTMLHSGTCGSCGGQCGSGGVCGSCGLSGTANCGNANRPNCVSTGVPNMKVTEYPGTSEVPRTSNAGKSPVRFPELEAQPNLFPPGPHVPMHIQPPLEGHPHDGEVHPHSSGHPHGDIHHPGPDGPPRPHGPPGAETNEPLRPIPQEQPLPVTPKPEPEQ